MQKRCRIVQKRYRNGAEIVQRLCTNVEKCAKMRRNAQKCAKMIRNVRKCADMSRNVQKTGANNRSARGEQSDPRTAENAPENQPLIQFIGRKRFTHSALSSGEVSKGGGVLLKSNHFEFFWYSHYAPSGVSYAYLPARILLV